MEVSELFAHINSAYRGSDDDAPISGSDDYSLWINTTNRLQRYAATDGKQTRASSWIQESVGTLSAGTNSFDLDDQFLIPDSYILVTPIGATSPSQYIIVKPGENQNFLNQQATYISGFDPQTLTFIDSIDSTNTSLIGADVTIQGYTIPDDVADDTNTLTVDDPYWLVMAVAAELAFNDLQYVQKAPDLQAKANDLYENMNNNNRRGTYGQARIAPTSVNRIRGVSYHSNDLVSGGQG